jgi:hypothetical protein
VRVLDATAWGEATRDHRAGCHTFAARGAVAALVWTGLALWEGEWLVGLLWGPVAFLDRFALLVIFIRAQHI